MDSTANLRLAGVTPAQARELRSIAARGRTTGVVGSGRVVNKLIELGLVERPEESRGYFYVRATADGLEAVRVLDGGQAYVDERGRKALAEAYAARCADGTQRRYELLAAGRLEEHRDAEANPRPATDAELRAYADAARWDAEREAKAKTLRGYRRMFAAYAKADAIEAILAERAATTAVELEPAPAVCPVHGWAHRFTSCEDAAGEPLDTVAELLIPGIVVEAHPDDDAAELAAPAAGGRRYVAGAVHYFPADDPGVALCGKSARGSIDTEAALTCAACGAHDPRRALNLRLDRIRDEVLEERRQAEAPAPALPGIDAAIVEAELGGRQELELVVVPCSGAKLEQAAPAGELYTGTLHAAARSAADTVVARRGGRTVVLSALYGLVELDRVVDPYDLTVGDAGAIDPVGVALQLAATGATRVVALTPNRYTELLRQACKAAGVELTTPLAGCRGIGEQRGRLAAIRRGDLAVVRAA